MAIKGREELLLKKGNSPQKYFPYPLNFLIRYDIISKSIRMDIEAVITGPTRNQSRFVTRFFPTVFKNACISGKNAHFPEFDVREF